MKELNLEIAVIFSSWLRRWYRLNRACSCRRMKRRLWGTGGSAAWPCPEAPWIQRYKDARSTSGRKRMNGLRYSTGNVVGWRGRWTVSFDLAFLIFLMHSGRSSTRHHRRLYLLQRDPDGQKQDVNDDGNHRGTRSSQIWRPFQRRNNEDSLIVTFLALLELIRLGLARAYQEREFETSG